MPDKFIEECAPSVVQPIGHLRLRGFVLAVGNREAKHEIQNHSAAFSSFSSTAAGQALEQ